MAAVELRDMCKSFGAFRALDRLNLTIENGEFLVLPGPSGCGKSTTMRLIAGLNEPTPCEIRIDGRRVNDIPARDRDLAIVSRNCALYPHMTVAQNIGYPLKIARRPEAERIERVRVAADQVEMAHPLELRPAELSRRQRVALAHVIARTPWLFLMDEPLSNLDAELRTAMRAKLRQLEKSLTTATIYITHDQVETMTLADRIVILDQARIQQMGTPSNIYARPVNTFLEGFNGPPPMNLIDGTVTAGMFRLAGGASDLPGAPDVAATIGVRPENPHLAADGEGVVVVVVVGTVHSSEPFGKITFLNLRLGEAPVAMKVGPQDGRAMDSGISLTVDRVELHVFDGATGERPS